MKLNLEYASKLVSRATADAQKTGLHVTAAVVDVAGRLVALQRMDGALPASSELAKVKAETALLFGMPTKDMAPASTLIPAFGKPVAFFGGGVPLKLGGEIVGALGIAGGMPDQDHELALAVSGAV